MALGNVVLSSEARIESPCIINCKRAGEVEEAKPISFLHLCYREIQHKPIALCTTRPSVQYWIPIAQLNVQVVGKPLGGCDAIEAGVPNIASLLQSSSILS